MPSYDFVTPGVHIGRDGGSYQECSVDAQGNIDTRYMKYCTIRDFEKAPATSNGSTGRKWVLLYRTPDFGKPSSSEKVRT